MTTGDPRIIRLDAVAKVTGRAKYTADLGLAGMGYAAIVRSPVPRGELRAVDCTAAAAVAGVLCTLVGTELRGLGIADQYFGLAVRDQPVLTTDQVRFAGEPIAAVVATTAAIAEYAASLVEVDIEPEPAVESAQAGLAGASLVHPELPPTDPPNVAARVEFAAGDVEAALARAHYVHDETYEFPMVSHAALEPHCCLAEWNATGDALLVHSSTQSPFKVRADLARLFGLPTNAVQVRATFIGGGFGGKLLTKYEPLAAALARKTGRAVKLVLGAEESFRTVVRHSASVRVRTGVDEAGRIVARDSLVILDTGAYADKGPGVAKKAAYRAKGPYDIADFRSVALAVYTNNVPAGAFRGYSTPQVAWAGESAVNEIAVELGVDALELRRRWLVGRGGAFMPNDTPMDADLVEGLEAAAAGIDWDAPRTPGRGKGLAVGVKDGGGGPSRAEAEVRVFADGAVEVLTGTTEIGQGSLTAFAQIAARELGCSASQVRVALVDTAVSPFDHGTEASRSTVLVGSAVRNAARDAAAELAAVARAVCGDGAVVELNTASVSSAGTTLPLADVIARSRNLPPSIEFEIGPVVCRGVHETYVGADSPLGTPSNFYEVGHGAVEVAVDRDTGQIELTRYAAVADVGKAINPQACHAQDEGSVLMAIGHTLMEELHVEAGELLNPSLIDYAVPRVTDLPVEGIRTTLIENEDGPGPYGAKGAGEGGIIPVSPAVAAAVFDACGIRMRRLPLTPERVWRALHAGGDADVPQGL